MKIKLTNSIGFKILFFYLLLALINVSFVIFIIFENQVDLISKNSRLEIEQQFSNLVTAVKRSYSEMQKGDLFKHDKNKLQENQFIELIKPYVTDFFIITDNGEVLYRSGKDLEPPDTMTEDALRSITAENFSGKEYYMRVDHDNEILYGYIPFGNDRSINNILLAVRDMGRLNESLRNLYRQAVFIILVVLFFHAVFALTLFKYIINPVRQMHRGAEKISGGNFDTRIPIAGNGDEFDSLAAAFNSMAGSIDDHMKKLSGEIETTQEKIEKTGSLMVRDELTGLYNQVYLLERLTEEVKKSSGKDIPLAVIFIDLDNFKTIDTIYGSNSVNVILYETAKIITANCSENHLAARFVNDRFAILSISSSFKKIKNLSEKIKTDIENNQVITPDGTFTVTASIGIAFKESIPGNAKDTPRELTESAKTALTRAKEEGKNRVVVA